MENQAFRLVGQDYADQIKAKLLQRAKDKPTDEQIVQLVAALQQQVYSYRQFESGPQRLDEHFEIWKFPRPIKNGDYFLSDYVGAIWLTRREGLFNNHYFPLIVNAQTTLQAVPSGYFLVPYNLIENV